MKILSLLCGACVAVSSCAVVTKSSGSRDSRLEVNGSDVSIRYSYIGTPLQPDIWKNSLEVECGEGAKAEGRVKVEAALTAEIPWDGKTHFILCRGRKLLVMVPEMAWDGEDQRRKDIIIVTDGHAAKAIVPEYAGKTDYRKELGKILPAVLPMGTDAAERDRVIGGISELLRVRP